MDRLQQRLSVADRAVATLRELALCPTPSRIERDAAIQRFEYSFEATSKAAQRFLALIEGIDTGSPKSTIRACRQAGLFSVLQAEHALAMVDDRNLTAHTYNERLAEAIFARSPQHLTTLESWLGRMRSRMSV